MILEAETSNGWKPLKLCVDGGINTDSPQAYFLEKKKQLDDAFLEMGLVVKKVLKTDYQRVIQFAEAYFYGHINLNPARLYQVISFGESILLTDQKDQVKGYILEASYLRDQISHGASMAVHPDLAGKKVGSMLFMYSSILAMKNGAILKKGIISPDNYSSIKSIINGCGASIISFDNDLLGMGPKLIFNLPLIPRVLNRSVLNEECLEELMQRKILSSVPCDELEKHTSRLGDEVIIALHAGSFIFCQSSTFHKHYLR